MKHALYFNLDGTLIDSVNLIVEAKSYTLEQFGIKDPDPDMIRATGGMAIREAFQLLTHNDSDTFLAEAQQVYHRRLKEITLEKGYLRPGVITTLQHFADMGDAIGYFSERPGETLDEVLDKLGLSKFTEVYIATDESERRPAPDMIEFLREQLGAEEAENYTIGSMTLDIRMGHNAGTKTVAIPCGANTIRVLKTFSPDHIIDDITQLTNIIV